MDFLIFAPIFSVLALMFAEYLARKLMQESEGTDKMIYIAKAIRNGANAYLKRQYKWVIIFFAFIFVLLLVFSILEYISIFVPFAFLTGGFFSGLSGFIGMKIATNAN